MEERLTRAHFLLQATERRRAEAAAKAEANKAATHFPRLKEATGIGFDKMLFFDDCNWGDHCGKVAAACKEPNGHGVVTVRTPRGLGVAEWQRGLEEYEKAALARAS